jgi:dolichol-phosphate mannosyltransferase
MRNYTKKLRGPIAILGAGGFIGINLLNKILQYRKDVVGFSSNPNNNWRIKQNNIPAKNIAKCDLLKKEDIASLIKKYKPKTIFNLAGYGGYSKQKDVERIYQTNFQSTVNLIEELKKNKFSSYIYAGSQSEYGLNSAAPSEDSKLLPNSHYAVSKTAVSYLLNYYGKIEKLPVVHLRLYSIYGPWEEPDRLMPVLIDNVKIGKLPHFVDPSISRDFIYVDDVVEAMLVVAERLCHSGKRMKRAHPESDSGVASFPRMTLYGEAFNVASGKKTTIKELAYLVKKIFKIKQTPVFGSMKNRIWDLKDWYGNPSKMNRFIGWKAKISLKEGLEKFYQYEK